MSLLSLSRRTRPTPHASGNLPDSPALDLHAAQQLLEAFACPTGEHDYCTAEATHRLAHSRTLSVSPVCAHHPVLTCPDCS